MGVDWWVVLVGFAAGAAVGAAFFAGLWWTARRLVRARRPGLLMAASLVVRMAVVVGVFLLLSRFGRWEALAAGMAGFILVRILVVHRIKPGPEANR